MKLWKGAKKALKGKAPPKKDIPSKPPPKVLKAKAPSQKGKSHTQAFPGMMDRTIAAQQAVRARNDWRAQIRAHDAQMQALLHQHLFAQPNHF